MPEEKETKFGQQLRSVQMQFRCAEFVDKIEGEDGVEGLEILVSLAKSRIQSIMEDDLFLRENRMKTNV